MELRINLGELYPAQQEIVDSPARFKVLVCGRRFGKTTIAIDTLCRALLDGQTAAYFAPTYRMGAEVWREMNTLLAPLRLHASEKDWRLELAGGGVFECWSLAQGAGETVRGRHYHFVVIDEAALFESADAWYGAIRPLLTDTQGGALFASTPRGRNWFWHLYRRGLDPKVTDWQAWRFPTAANPHIPPEEIEAARQGMPERFFQQEYEAEFLDDGGLVFRNVDQACVGQPGMPVPDENGETRCVFGVDWGKDHDFTCISVMTCDGTQLHLERFNQIGWTVQRDRLKALNERFQPSVILAEENSIGSVNIDALIQEDLPVRGFVTTQKSKAELIDTLALAMEKGETRLLNDEVLKYELMAYEMSRTAYGWSYGAPPGGHDDTVIATALSLRASRWHCGPILSFV